MATNLSEVQRAQQKEAALLRAKFNLGVTWDRIDYNIDVIAPAKRQIAVDATKGILPTYELEETNGS